MAFVILPEAKSAPSAGRSLVILLGLFAVFYFHELASFTISIDDELGAYRDDASVWIGQGRWAAYLIERYLIQQPVVPFLPIALFGLLTAIGYLFFVRSLGGRPGLLSLAVFPLFAAFPTWALITAFKSNSPSVGLGVLTSSAALSAYRVARERAELRPHPGLMLGASVVLGAIAIGCYQSFVLFLGVGLLLSVLSMSLAPRATRAVVMDCVVAAAIIAASLVLYELSLRLALTLAHTSVGPYIEGFFRPDLLLTQTQHVLSATLDQLRAVYLGLASVYGSRVPIIICVIVLATAGVVCGMYKIAGLAGSLVAALAVVLALAIPFAINLISNGAVPLRSLVAVPAVLSGLVLLGFTSGPRWLFRVGLLALALLYFSMIEIVSEFNASRELVQVHDRQLALALSERIAAVADVPAPDKPVMLDVFGYLPFQTPYPRIETIGASLFEWDDGNPYRMVTYMKLIGLPTYQVIPRERRADLLDQFVTMPPWPAKDSVAKAPDGTILVKLSDEPSSAYRDLLASDDLPAPADAAPFYRLSAASPGSWSVINASVSQSSDAGLELVANADPQILFKTGADGLVRNCSRIEVDARLKIERATPVQVFFQPVGQAGFTEASSATAWISPPGGGGFVDVRLQITSRAGFADAFRLDPVAGDQRVSVGTLALFCRHVRPAG